MAFAAQYLLRRFDALLRARHTAMDRAAPSRAARDGGAAGVPPCAAPPSDSSEASADDRRGILDLGPMMIPGDALGRAPRGPQWRAVPLNERQTWVVGPGLAFPLCAAGLDGLHAALSAARERRGS